MSGAAGATDEADAKRLWKRRAWLDLELQRGRFELGAMMYRTAPGTHSLDPARTWSLNSAPNVRCGKAEWVGQQRSHGQTSTSRLAIVLSGHVHRCPVKDPRPQQRCDVLHAVSCGARHQHRKCSNVEVLALLTIPRLLHSRSDYSYIYVYLPTSAWHDT